MYPKTYSGFRKRGIARKSQSQKTRYSIAFKDRLFPNCRKRSRNSSDQGTTISNLEPKSPQHRNLSLHVRSNSQLQGQNCSQNRL